MKQTEEPNYYQLLNIDPEAGVSEIIHAYYELCQNFSIFPYSSESEIIQTNSDFFKYKKAYLVLTSNDQRKKYDESLELLGQEIIDTAKQDYIRSISETSDLEELLFLNDAPKLSNREIEFTKMKTDITNNMFEKAKNYLENEKYHEAINLFRKLIDINNSKANFHSYLGLALMKKGWNNYAHEEFKLALHFDPNDEIALEHYKAAQTTAKLNSKVTTVLDIEKAEQNGIMETIKAFFKRIINLV